MHARTRNRDEEIMDRARTAIEGFRHYKQRQQAPLSPQRPFVMLQTHKAPERRVNDDVKDIIVRQELLLRDRDL